MRRYGNLYPTFLSFENLHHAYRKARRGTRRTSESTAFFFHLERELLQLQEELAMLTYQPAAYRYFRIHDPKERTISVAPFRDRVVHHALVNVLETLYERLFIYDSYATRKGKGTHAAILRAQHFLKKNFWFLKTDVDQFFNSIRHDILLSLLSRKVKDTNLLIIADRIINQGGRQGIGLPIGNLTSQFFANVYLDQLDHYVKEELRVKHYVRYMDDLVLFAPDKKILREFRFLIRQFLQRSLGLQLKESATYLNSATNGLTFLGRRIFPNTVRIARPNLKRMLRRMDRKVLAFHDGNIDDMQLVQSLNSTWALLSQHDTYALKRNILQKYG